MAERPTRGGIDGSARAALTLALSRLILTWERIEVAVWPLATFALLLLALALSGALLALPFWGHIAFLIAAIAALIGLLVLGFRRYAGPSTTEARRRLETVNDLEHHPLETLQDKPSQDDPIALALWEEHRNRTMARLGKLSVGGPAPKLAKLDPFALRIGAAFLFILALFAAGDRAGENLAATFVPNPQAGEPPLTVAIDAWLAPPDYTALPPIFIARADVVEQSSETAEQTPEGNGHAVPVGSRMVVQVTGIETETVLISPAGRVVMETFAANGVAIEHEITQSGLVSVEVDGQILQTWDILAITDAPPEIELAEVPFASLRQALTIPYIVNDDYGVSAIRIEIERADKPAGSARSGAYEDSAEKIVSPLPVPDRSGYGEVRRAFRDYSAHPWAGGQVLLTLYATDATGQEGKSEPMEITLPARLFNHPVARAIVEARRELAWDPTRNFQNVADLLHALAWNRMAYGEDITVFMSLRETERRLDPPRGADLPSDANIALVIDMLWKTALYLEDGGVSLALERLREAEQALMDAIADGAEMSEIEQLMNELQQAMNEYMDAMSEQMAQQLRDGEAPEMPELGGDDMNMLSNQDMDRMMDQIREMMRNGNTESAMQMLEQMRQMMENLQAGMSSQMSPEGREAMDLLESMQDIMESQRELMDRTHRNAQEQRDNQFGQQGQQGQQGQGGDQRQSNRNNNQGQGQGGGEGQGQQGGDGMRPQDGLSNSDAVLQDALRRQLGEIMRQFGEMMGEIPEPFGRADEGMSDSANSLSAGDPAEALGGQGRAMDALQDAAQSARNAFLEQFQSPMSLGNQLPGQTGQQGMDPFGREPSENYRGPLQGEVTVPDEGGIERSRAIRDELRRRSGERSRPQQELDYIDRLLDPFE